jgi:hypothetical protein
MSPLAYALLLRGPLAIAELRVLRADGVESTRLQ